MGFKSGFIGIVGRPNVGKSSLLNQLLGEKVSIVSNKAQTTRHNVRGILTVPNKYQLIFIDTPGIHTSSQELNRQMNAAVFKGIKAADLIVFLAPANEKIGKNDLYLLNEILKKQISFIIGLSKKDLLSKEGLDAKIQEWINLTESKTSVLPISIYDQSSLNNLIKHLLKTLPPNDYQYFSNDEITDQPLKHQIQDLIREAILFKTGQEVPHSTLVIVETLENQNQILKIQAAIIVERNSQKGILIGPRGKKIKDIKYRVRKELKKKYPEHEIDLTIMVKVKSNWRNSPSLLKKAMLDRGSLSD